MIGPDGGERMATAEEIAALDLKKKPNPVEETTADEPELAPGEVDYEAIKKAAMAAETPQA